MCPKTKKVEILNDFDCISINLKSKLYLEDPEKHSPYVFLSDLTVDLEKLEAWEIDSNPFSNEKPGNVYKLRYTQKNDRGRSNRHSRMNDSNDLAPSLKDLAPFELTGLAIAWAKKISPKSQMTKVTPTILEIFHGFYHHLDK